MLGFGRVLKAVPFASALRILGAERTETSHARNREDELTLALIGKSLITMSRYTWWDSQCLVLAMAGMQMLARRGIESTMYLGTARDKKTGKMVAHAWLRSGEAYVTGAYELERYVVVGVFGKTLQNSKKRRSANHGTRYRGGSSPASAGASAAAGPDRRSR
jgi:hypothetical protein